MGNAAGANKGKGNGSSLENFKIIATLGRGSFGVVDLAEQEVPIEKDKNKESSKQKRSKQRDKDSDDADDEDEDSDDDTRSKKVNVVLKQLVLSKIIDDDDDEIAKSQRKDIDQALEGMLQLNHDNLVSLLQYFYQTKNENADKKKKGENEPFFHHGRRLPSLYLVVEFVDSRLTLRKCLRLRRGRLLPESSIRHCFKQIVSAVHFIHEKAKSCHRKITARNVFILPSAKSSSQTPFLGKFSVKLSDFEVAKAVEECCNEVALAAIHGSATNRSYCSPEFCENEKKFTDACDIWALGVLLHQLCTFKFPFEGAELFELYNNIVGNKRTVTEIDGMYSSDLDSLIDELLTEDPDERPTAEEILQRDFFKTEKDDDESSQTSEEGEISEVLALVSPFDTDYWSTLKRVEPVLSTSWLRTDSDVVEIVPYRDAGVSIAVCSAGHLVAIDNRLDGDDERASVVWQRRLDLPSVEHASFDEIGGRLYVSVDRADSSGIFYADLIEIAAAGNERSVPVERFCEGFADKSIQWTSETGLKRRFLGLACDCELQLLFCCDAFIKQSVGVWSTDVVGKSYGQLLVEIEMTSLRHDCVFRPHRCAVYSNPFVSKPLHKDADEDVELSREDVVKMDSEIERQLVVSDITNSQVHLFHYSRLVSGLEVSSGRFICGEETGLKKRRRQFAFGFLTTLATEGTQLGGVRRPTGVTFDLAGHLFVADTGNHRFQVLKPDLDGDKQRNNVVDDQKGAAAAQHLADSEWSFTEMEAVFQQDVKPGKSASTNFQNSPLSKLQLAISTCSCVTPTVNPSTNKVHVLVGLVGDHKIACFR